MRGPGTALIVICTSSHLWAQAGDIRGTVLDSADRPVPSAGVTAASRRATTDQSGYFRLTGFNVGDTVRVSIRALGFRPYETLLRVADRSFSFHLDRLPPQPLPAVTVEAKWAKPARYNATGKFDEFYRRRALGKGRFFTREDLERATRTEAIYMLQGLNGVRIYPPSQFQKPLIKLSRCQFEGGIALFIDGQSVTSRTTAAETLFDLHLNDVEAMEVYTSQSQMPAEAIGAGCAAVYVWTRYSQGSVLKKNP